MNRHHALWRVRTQHAAVAIDVQHYEKLVRPLLDPSIASPVTDDEKPVWSFGSDESELKLQILVLARFLYANRYPLRSKTR